MHISEKKRNFFFTFPRQFRVSCNVRSCNMLRELRLQETTFYFAAVWPTHTVSAAQGLPTVPVGYVQQEIRVQR